MLHDGLLVGVSDLLGRVSVAIDQCLLSDGLESFLVALVQKHRLPYRLHFLDSVHATLQHELQLLEVMRDLARDDRYRVHFSEVLARLELVAGELREVRVEQSALHAAIKKMEGPSSASDEDEVFGLIPSMCD